VAGALCVLALGLGVSESLSAKTLVFQSQSEALPERTVKASEAQPSSVQQTLSSAASSANSELFFMLEQLQQEVRSLRGMLEEQANQIRHMQSSGKSRYRDLDSRVLDLSKKMASIGSASDEPVVSPLKQIDSTRVEVEPGMSVPVAGVKSPMTRPASPPSDAQKREYQQAYSLIKEKKFDEAIDRLHQFIERYPEGELTGNAYYWLGEVYLVLPKLEQAKQAFTIVVSSFADHRKAADAMFKLGVAYDRLQNPEQSEKYLIEVQSKFPNSTAAKLAKSYKINR